MKIVIYGATEIGKQIARDFYAENDITILDPSRNELKSIEDLDISTLEGNGTNINMLKEAGISDADAFIACSASDEANIVASMAAKAIKDLKTMCFIQKQESFESLEVARESEYNTFDIDHIIWLKDLVMQDIVRVVTKPKALNFENFAGGKANLLEYRVTEKDYIAGKRIKECAFPSDVLIVGIVRDYNLNIPTGDTQILIDDKIIFIGYTKSLNILLSKYSAKTEKVKEVTIIGGGTLSRMVASELEKLGLKLKIIENNLSRCEFLFTQLRSSTMIINGDGTDLKLLETEDIKSSSVVIAITDNDEKNLLCSLYCKQFGVPKVITRVSDNASIDLFEKVGIDIVISIGAAINKLIRNSFIEKDFGVLATIEKGQGELIELEVSDEFNGRALKEIQLPTKAVIAIVKCSSRVVIPNGNTILKSGDKLTIFTLSKDVEDITNFFKPVKDDMPVNFFKNDKE